ncbi:ArsR/SmtB family transcription factor [Devosia chinhatensis]|uniref:ArsR/SmtB family transcription factor n=1 Tax=Devosia chinhatensis TaxID=429727 RepID=UPI0009FFCC7B|nr:helix-turn-helix domain-containing protein [Devosia chinhatensis]
MSNDDKDDLVFKALSHRVRRRLLDHLKQAPQTTGALVAMFPDLDRCTIMQHLGVLEGAGLVHAEKRGRKRWNHLDALPVHAIHERWIGPYAAYAAAMLSRLSRAVDMPAD